VSDLCTRCASLFGECHPLVGQQPCAFQPNTRSQPRIAAAIAVDERSHGFRVEPILVTDYYRKDAL